MEQVTVFHYDAFTSKPNQGNPAGVVLDADHLSEEEMQRIARKVGFNETVFVLSSHTATVKLKYFTPGHEINLCGHATMASLYALKTRGRLGNEPNITIQTNVGILPVTFTQSTEHDLKIKMKQDKPQFLPFKGDLSALAASIGLEMRDIDTQFPVVYGSTGTWTLLIPMKGLETFKHMEPQTERFPSVLHELPRASLHPFCQDAYDKTALMHARHFSSPYSGTVEDPVTGTASGVMGAYYLTYIDPQADSTSFVVEQGQEIGRDGRIAVEVLRREQGDLDVYITGTATFVAEMNITY